MKRHKSHVEHTVYRGFRSELHTHIIFFASAVNCSLAEETLLKSKMEKSKEIFLKTVRNKNGEQFDLVWSKWVDDNQVGNSGDSILISLSESKIEQIQTENMSIYSVIYANIAFLGRRFNCG